MSESGGKIYFSTLFWAILIFVIVLVMGNIITKNNDHQNHVTEITNLHVQRVEACLRYHKINTRSECEDYLFTQGQDEEYYKEVLKR